MSSRLSEERSKKIERHPCFNAGVQGRYGRVHLPVAPGCNVQCNYCNRKYDCVNESRPGVTSAVLSPAGAVEYIGRVLAKEPRITVAGIAGPGDPFARPEATLNTLAMIGERFPELALCVSSNGLALAKHVETLAEIGVSHVTVTVNAVDPTISEKIYSWIMDDGVIYKGWDAAALLLARQMDAIVRLKKQGIVVKVNTIVIPGVNEHHVTDVAERMADLGVDVLNCMPMHPNPGTPFGHLAEPTKERMNAIRGLAEKYLPQMRHCRRCRADAVGLLGEDKSEAFRGCLSECAKGTAETGGNIAVKNLVRGLCVGA